MNFKEWLSLNETVSVYVQGYDKPKQINDLHELSYYLMQKLTSANLNPRYGSLNMIEPDGDDYWKKEGIINFYVQDLKPTQIEKMLQAIKYFLDEAKIKYGQISKETWEQASKWRKQEIEDWGKSLKDVRVIRIPILQMPDVSKENQPPELNMTNVIASVIFHDLLNFPNLENPIPVRDLLMKIDALPDFKLDIHTQEPYQRGIVYHGEISKERITRNLEGLKQIAQWAINNGYDYLTLL